MSAFAYHNIDPVALRLGGLEIRWYGIAYFVGILLCAQLATRIAKRYPTSFSADTFYELIPFAVVGVVLGGKLGDVLLYHPSTLLSDPLYPLRIWESGLAFHGGMLGLIAAFYYFCKTRRLNFFEVMDVTAVVTPLTIAAVRVANFINGELYGRVTDVAWGMHFPGAGPLPRHPSQLYEAVTEGLLVFAVLWFLYPKWRHKPGTIGFSFLTFYGAGRFVAEYFREPDPVVFLPISPEVFSMGQLLSVAMIAAGLLGSYISYFKLTKAR